MKNSHNLSVQEKDRKNVLAALEEIQADRALTKIQSYYPETGPLRRDLYPKQMLFFAAGKHFQERCFMAANRVGKSLGVGGYEVTCHLTGIYPDWWPGRRFDRPVQVWASGKTSITTRDILQSIFLGPKERIGTGMIPARSIVHTIPKSGVPDALEIIYVRHEPTGQHSMLQFKSYDQKRQAFEGTTRDVILLDEEPPLDIYIECLTRTMATDIGAENGLILLTFTPLQGLTELIQQFLPGGRVVDDKPRAHGKKFFVPCTWDEVPHLSQEAKDALYESYPPYIRKARSKGIPSFGAGAIYPFEEELIKVEDFAIPDHWPRCFALDAQPLRKSHVMMAWDREAQIVYVTHCYKREGVEPAVQVQSIKAHGDWIPGVGDAAALVKDSERYRYIDVYKRLGLDISLPQKGVESGIQEVYNLMAAGQLKVFVSCTQWFDEYRLYRRNEDGRIVKENDHLLDSTRYGVVSGIKRAVTKSPDLPKRDEIEFPYTNGPSWDRHWMSR